MESQKELTPLQAKLLKIQADLKAPKNRFNAFGKYNYRDAEGILEAVKPHLEAAGILQTLTDRVEILGDRYYVVATIRLELGDEFKIVEGWAREEETKKGMDGSQITGASSSYARKYGLNGMYLIDDTKDSDGTNEGEGTPKKPKKQEPTPSVESGGDNGKTQPAATTKKVLELNTKAFDGAANWVAGTEGMVLDVLKILANKYDMSPEVETAIAKKAAELRADKK